MPEHMLMSELEIINDRGLKRHWSAAEKPPIVEGTLDGDARARAVSRRPPHAGGPSGRSRHRCRDCSPRHKPLPRHHADTALSCHSPFPLRKPGRGLHTVCSLSWTPRPRAAPVESSTHLVIACAVRNRDFARGAGWVGDFGSLE